MTNIDIQKELYAAFGSGDVQTIMNRLTDDVIWNFEGPASIPYCGKRRGKAEVMGFFAGIGNTETNSRVDIDEYIAQGDRVVALGRYVSTVKDTGKSFSVALAHAFQFKDGKVVRFDCYTDNATMAEARVAKAVAV